MPFSINMLPTYRVYQRGWRLKVWLFFCRSSVGAIFNLSYITYCATQVAQVYLGGNVSELDAPSFQSGSGFEHRLVIWDMQHINQAHARTQFSSIFPFLPCSFLVKLALAYAKLDSMVQKFHCKIS